MLILRDRLKVGYPECWHPFSLNHLDVGLFDDLPRLGDQSNVPVVQCLQTSLHPAQSLRHIDVQSEYLMIIRGR